MNTNTWPDGTAKSQSNAFTTSYKPVQITPTLVSKKTATRVNKNICAVAWCGSTNSGKAAR